MSVEYSACKMRACYKGELNQFTRVVNKEELEYYLWIELPFHIEDRVRLYSLKEQITSCSSPLKDIHDLYDGSLDTTTGQPNVIHDTNKWVRINKAVLNLQPGQHIYKLVFMRTDTSDIEVPLYFSYILQDDCPDKPYIYMER